MSPLAIVALPLVLSALSVHGNASAPASSPGLVVAPVPAPSPGPSSSNKGGASPSPTPAPTPSDKNIRWQSYKHAAVSSPSPLGNSTGRKVPVPSSRARTSVSYVPVPTLRSRKLKKSNKAGSIHPSLAFVGIAVIVALI